MDLFGLGMAEVILILVIALIVMGPGRIGEFGQTLGKMVRTLKKASFDLKTQISREIEGENKDNLSTPKISDTNGTKETDTTEPQIKEPSSPKE